MTTTIKLKIVIIVMKKICYSKYFTLALMGGALLLPTGCGGNIKDNVRGTLGLNRESPDEFAVITRAPLEIPKHLTLPPPVPGMQRPQEKPALDTAKEAVFGENSMQAHNTNAAVGIEAIMLDKTGATQTQPNIREMVNQETKELADKNTPVAKKLLGLGGKDVEPTASIVDAKAEYERIKKNKEEGKSILEGKTPVIKD